MTADEVKALKVGDVIEVEPGLAYRVCVGFIGISPVFTTCHPLGVLEAKNSKVVSKSKEPATQKPSEPQPEFTCPQCGGNKFYDRAVDPCNRQAGKLRFCDNDRARCQWRSAAPAPF